MAKYFGAGRARARAEDRQAARLRAAVLRQVLLVLHGGSSDRPRDVAASRAPWADLAVVAVEVRRGGNVEVTFAHDRGGATSARASELLEVSDAALAARLAAALQRELAAHVPRRRTPEVRVRFVPATPEEGGPR